MPSGRVLEEMQARAQHVSPRRGLRQSRAVQTALWRWQQTMRPLGPQGSAGKGDLEVPPFHVQTWGWITCCGCAAR
jgi:hypothetical protein